jgi:hypothetical protein
MKWKLQFSISSLLWLTVCCALLFTSVVMYRRMVVAERQTVLAEQRRMEAESQAALMRKAAGCLVIGDPKLVHGFEVETHEHMAWKWRLFLPSHRRFVLKVATGDLPPQGMPNDEPNETPLGLDGEIAIKATLRKTTWNTWEMILSYSNEKLDLKKGAYEPSRSSSKSFSVSSSVMEKFEGDCSYDSDRFGGSGTETAGADKPIILLRNRLLKKSATGQTISLAGPMPGIAIWLEKQK